MILFFLTLLLSTMLLSQLIEEKSNKIIEVHRRRGADRRFVRRQIVRDARGLDHRDRRLDQRGRGCDRARCKTGGLATLPPPAVGWPAFLALTIVYFAMNYLLLGAVFLTIGAQASTVREVQTLSMPVTFGQVVIFGFAATAVSAPDSPRGSPPRSSRCRRRW